MKRIRQIHTHIAPIIPHLICIGIFGSFAFFSLWLMQHTLSYDAKTHQILLAPKVWSDFGSHLPLIRSFSMGDNFHRMFTGHLPEYPIFPGAPIRYHFLFFALAGFFERIGFRIDWALNLPSAFGFFLLLSCIYILSTRLFHNKMVGILAVLFSLFNGNLTFLKFFEKFPLGPTTFKDIVNNKEFLSFAPWGKGDISAFWNLNIYTNQRHLALAFGLALVFMLLCIILEKKRHKYQLFFILPVGIGIGLFPFFHQPTLIIFAVIMILYFLLFPRLRMFLVGVGILSVLLILPQAKLLVGGDTSLAFYPGYLIHDTLTPLHFVTYWFHNIGIHLILIPIGFLFAPKFAKKILIPLFFIFLTANLFRFSIEIAGSHKFFNFTLILGNILSAYCIVRLLEIITHFLISLPYKKVTPSLVLFVSVSLVDYVCIALLILMMTLSGVIDFFAIYNDTYGTVEDVVSNPASSWIATHTSPSAVFMNSSYLFHPASMAGRKIFQGWPYFTWSAGYKEDRTKVMKTVYESKNPTVFCPILEKRSIDYVTVEDTKGDTNLPSIDVSYFYTTYLPTYTNPEHTYLIYSRQALCPKK